MVDKSYVSERLLNTFGEEKATELAMSNKSTMELAAMVDGWIEHDGKGIPVDGATLVYVKFRSGKDDTACPEPKTAEWWSSNWGHHYENPECDITHYRIVKENQDA